jgi:acetylornithine/LysW-gamma-L-lysine aminotransferase
VDSEGREYIDFFNGHGAALFGHSNPELLAALQAASRGLWSVGAGFDSPVREELAETLGGFVGGGRVFLCNSGSEAIEAALKLSVALRPGRSRIMACRRAFHGRTSGALSLTFNPKYRMPFKALTADVEHHNPEDLPGRIDENTIAVFVEPVQGEGGVYPLPEGVGRAISESCARAGAILVADEIQSGMGRCGAMLASMLTGLDPDIICLAKGLAGGLPVGATVWKDTLGDFPSHSHGSTYGGNELVCGVAVAALGLIREKNYATHAAELGALLRSSLEQLGESGGKRIIKGVRGLGLMVGLELDVPSIGVVKALQARGLLSLTAGPRVVRFLPSYAAGSDDVFKAVGIVKETLAGFQP